MEIEIIISLIVFAFMAGAIDAAVGGGGLIQIPAIMSSLPHLQPATVFGTNKLASIFGTASAAYCYFKKVKLPWALLLVIALCSFMSALVGAATVTLIPVDVFKPIILAMLILMAVYTFTKKQFGRVHVQQKLTPKMMIYAAIGSVLIGFYDGVFGPGTGSFFIFFFIRFLSVDFLHASALSKIGNFTTNFAALSFFVPTGHVLFQIGFMMAVANILGALLGVRLALKYGSGFIRILFLILVTLLIGRMAYQMMMFH